MSKIISILSYALLGLSALFFLLFWFDVIDVNIFIIWSYILFGIAGASAILFPLVNLILNPKKAVRSLISVGILAVLALISYLIASDAIPNFTGAQKFDISATTSKMVGTGLWAMYILGLVAVLSILYTEVSKIFK